MSTIFDRITGSLAGKLVIILGLLILSGSGIFWYLSIETDKRDLMENSVAFISSFSEMIHRSIRHDMLQNRRRDIQAAIESIGATESVKRVSLFNRDGIIHYSSDRGVVGMRAQKASPACIGCHTDPSRPHETLVTGRQWTIYADAPGKRVLSFIEPIYNEPDCFTAQCHVHSQDHRVLGILMTDFSLYPIDARMKKKIVSTSLFTFLILSLSAAMLYFVLWRFVLKPITALSKGMERVSSGDLSPVALHESTDEIGKLSRTFNMMTNELHAARLTMETWTQSLEEEVEKKTVEIKKTQNKLIQAEKLAALGRLTADIAHEIRNPLSALGGFGRRLQKIAVGKKESEYSDIIVSEVDRLEHILRDILTFSREAKFHFARIPLTDIVQESVTAFAEVCAEHSITVVVNLDSDLPVLIDRAHVRQALDNLLSNAIDAMSKGGTLTVRTIGEEINNIRYVTVLVTDTGTGIPDDKLPLIFEPFHTTKVSGCSTGLGLSITRKIIEEHGGFIKARNNGSAGITFSISFPYQSNEDLISTPCWEFKKCGRDVNSELKCPAYPNFGRACWVVAGTFCEGKVQGTFAQKYENCKKCNFYNKVLEKEI